MFLVAHHCLCISVLFTVRAVSVGAISVTVVLVRGAGLWSYVGEFAHSIGLDSNVVLLELLLDLIDAGGDVFSLSRDTETRQDIRLNDNLHMILTDYFSPLVYLSEPAKIQAKGSGLTAIEMSLILHIYKIKM